MPNYELFGGPGDGQLAELTRDVPEGHTVTVPWLLPDGLHDAIYQMRDGRLRFLRSQKRPAIDGP